MNPTEELLQEFRQIQQANESPDFGNPDRDHDMWRAYEILSELDGLIRNGARLPTSWQQ